MEITWLGHSCFRLKGKEATIITDPYHKGLGYSLGKPSADIVTLSHLHPGHGFDEGVSGQPRVIKGPGEYEVAGVFITGIATFHDGQRGGERGGNTIYLIELDEVRVCHLGDLGHMLSAGQVEELGEVEVLLVPVGGVSTISAAQAAETARLLGPKVIVPMHFKTEAVNRELDPVDKFLREMGVKGATAPQPKLSVSRSGLSEEMRVVLLEYRR